MSTISTSSIVKTPGTCGGDARVDNTRIPVWLLVLHRKSGRSDAEVLDSYPTLTQADLDAVWDYYRDQMSDDMVMSPRGVENNLRFMADDKPEARTAKPDQFLDSSFTKKIKASGYVDQVKRGS